VQQDQVGTTGAQSFGPTIAAGNRRPRAELKQREEFFLSFIGLFSMSPEEAKSKGFIFNGEIE
jgi:hypothetical protein